MGAVISSFLMPSFLPSAASILTMLTHLVESFSKWASQLSDGAMIFLFLLGVVLMVKAIMGTRSGQPVGRYFLFGGLAWLISGIMFKHFKAVQNNVSTHAGGAADDALSGRG